MEFIKNQVKYRGSSSVDFADEILIGENPIITKNFCNNSDIVFFSIPTEDKKSYKEKDIQNYLLNFSILSFSLIALLILFTKIISITILSFNNFSISLFVTGYFILFISAIYLILKRKMISLVVKDETLYIKSFPALNKKIPVNQILKCELNTISNNKFTLNNKLHFALNEDGNKYKLPLTAGITLQLINGNHIIIGSHKS